MATQLVFALYLLVGLSVLAILPANSSTLPSGTSGLRLRDIEGVINCGSEADIHDTGFGQCTAVPCEAVVGESYVTKVDFTPHFSHEKLRLNIQLLQDPEHDDIIDTEIPDSAIEGGRRYSFEYSVNITGAFVDDALMVFHLYGDGEAGNEVLCLGIGLRVTHP